MSVFLYRRRALQGVGEPSAHTQMKPTTATFAECPSEASNPRPAEGLKLPFTMFYLNHDQISEGVARMMPSSTPATVNVASSIVVSMNEAHKRCPFVSLASPNETWKSHLSQRRQAWLQILLTKGVIQRSYPVRYHPPSCACTPPYASPAGPQNSPSIAGSSLAYTSTSPASLADASPSRPGSGERVHGSVSITYRPFFGGDRDSRVSLALYPGSHFSFIEEIRIHAPKPERTPDILLLAPRSSHSHRVHRITCTRFRHTAIHHTLAPTFKLMSSRKARRSHSGVGRFRFTKTPELDGNRRRKRSYLREGLACTISAQMPHSLHLRRIPVPPIPPRYFESLSRIDFGISSITASNTTKLLGVPKLWTRTHMSRGGRCRGCIILPSTARPNYRLRHRENAPPTPEYRPSSTMLSIPTTSAPQHLRPYPSAAIFVLVPHTSSLRPSFPRSKLQR
ncbi:hypothetical protein AB1N83_007517 [Pleurotus pulmonarius]